MLKEKLDRLITKFGPPAKARTIDAGMAASWRNVLPAEFVDFLMHYGTGTWLQGKFQFCRADEYAPVTQHILEGDKQFLPGRSALFGFTAFGEAYLWNSEHQVVVTVQLPRLIAAADSMNRVREDPELDIAYSLTFLNKDHTDMFEDTASAPRLFDRNLKRLGELEPGEIYGFVPALAMGGSAHLKNLKKVKALEHMVFLAQLGRAKLMDYNDGKSKFIRMLGS